MTYLGFSFIAALAVSISMFAETGSFLYAFLAYAGTGTLVLLSVVATTAVNMRSEDAEIDEDAYLA